MGTIYPCLPPARDYLYFRHGVNDGSIFSVVVAVHTHLLAFDYLQSVTDDLR